MASDKQALRLRASAPDRNPLNTNGQTGFTLTQFLQFAVLGNGQLPNAGKQPGAHVQLQIEAAPASAELTYLQNGRYETWPQGISLDVDHDGVVDQPAVLSGLPVIGVGQHNQYTLTLHNAGDNVAYNVVLHTQALGALRFGGGTADAVLNVGDIAPGVTQTLNLNGQIIAGVGSAEFIAALHDDQHREFDWAWALQAVDATAPNTVDITLPNGYVRVGQNRIVGTASDVAGVRNIEVQITELPSGVNKIIHCSVSAAFSGTWTCGWQIDTLAAIASFDLQARATDMFGNISAWSAIYHASADATAPTITLSTNSLQALADGFLTASELNLSGQAQDEQHVARVELCLEPAAGGCVAALSTDGDLGNTDGDLGNVVWQVDLGTLLSGDGVTHTLDIYAIDAAGNRSIALSRTFRVDSQPPVVTVDPITNGTIAIELANTAGNSANAFNGKVTDGDGIANVIAVVLSAQGNVIAQPVNRDGTTWRYVPNLPPGSYQAQIQATDVAGNASATDSFIFVVNSTGPSTLYLPIMFNQWAAPDVRGNLHAEALSADVSMGQVTLTAQIRNTGHGPVSGFWVDLYIDPSQTPTPEHGWHNLCNPPWPNERCFGGAWHVTQTLAAGEQMTLTSTTLTNDRQYSHWTGRLPSGAHTLYLAVDSFGSSHGLIDEFDELDNVIGPHQIIIAEGSPIVSTRAEDAEPLPNLDRTRIPSP